ncbi:hypothetical protein HHI36_001817 [Cryptolaemus montrouzieri]|uniref:Uncharacterized protein n=1 Tax=Cryptolaemus montrouzieri TaxID=559131 RepID=A0ABD2P8Q5_9CUCU
MQQRIEDLETSTKELKSKEIMIKPKLQVTVDTKNLKGQVAELKEAGFPTRVSRYNMQTVQNPYKTTHSEPILHKGRGVDRKSSKKSDKNPYRNQAATLSAET